MRNNCGAAALQFTFVRWRSEKHIIVIVESLYKASQNSYDLAKFIKKGNLTINYDKIVFQRLKF